MPPQLHPVVCRTFEPTNRGTKACPDEVEDLGSKDRRLSIA
jgi:hypothetical protein